MDEVSTEQVKRTDVLVGKLSAEERLRGEEILGAVRRAKGVCSAEAVALLFGVPAELIQEIWNEY